MIVVTALPIVVALLTLLDKWLNVPRRNLPHTSDDNWRHTSNSPLAYDRYEKWPKGKEI